MKMYTFNFMLFQTKLNLFFYYSEISSLKLDADSARSNTFQQTADENRRRNRWRHHPVLAPNNALELYMVHKASPCGEADSTPAKCSPLTVSISQGSGSKQQAASGPGLHQHLPGPELKKFRTRLLFQSEIF
ncbi:uncharacterized protein LJ206_006196 isoform 1-T1 [Theristicus caerulescens]